MSRNRKKKSRKVMEIKLDIDLGDMMGHISHAIFGVAGKGHKTGFKDKKKEANKKACRNNSDE